MYLKKPMAFFLAHEYYIVCESSQIFLRFIFFAFCKNKKLMMQEKFYFSLPQKDL